LVAIVLQTNAIYLIALTQFLYHLSEFHFIITLYFISEAAAVGNVIIEIVLQSAEKNIDGKILDEGRQEKFKVLSVAAM
jgi:hypothetical protein